MHHCSLIGVAVLLVVGGCQTYSRQPLDLDAHSSNWSRRSPEVEGVADYARRLDELGQLTPLKYDPTDGLTLREAEAVALFFNPRLRAARLKARVPAMGAKEAGRWDDPVLDVDAERIVESVAHPWVLGSTIGFTIPLSGRLGAEKRQALAEANAALLAVMVDEADIVADLHGRWIELAVLDQRSDLTRQYVHDLEQIVKTAGQLRQRGELDPIEEKLFKIEQVRRATELTALDLRRRLAEAAIKAVLGLTPDAGVKLVPSLPGVMDHVPPSARRQWVEQNHPKLRQAQAEYEVAERTLATEVRRQYPDLGLAGGYGEEEAEGRLLGGLSVPLPVFNANRRAIAEARAARAASAANAEATLEELAGGLARAEIALETARQQRELFERELTPLVDEQLRDARNLGKLGDVGTVVVLEVLTRAYETKIELLEAAIREAEAINLLNSLLRPGTGLDPTANEADENK